MIKTFRCKQTERIFLREATSKFSGEVSRKALRKLLLLDAADRLEDLRIPPGNELEKLAGTRKGRYSIRVNDQWRICFEWKEGDAYGVEIIGYH